jgi:DNA uptake protein ComE-like DNA-binding protein
MTVRRAQNSGVPSENLININTADEAQLTSVRGNTPSKTNPYAKDAFEDGTTTKLKEDPKGALININTADEAQ